MVHRGVEGHEGQIRRLSKLTIITHFVFSNSLCKETINNKRRVKKSIEISLLSLAPKGPKNMVLNGLK